MKFPLKDIEQLIEDELIEKGEGLIQEGFLKPLAEIEKNLWTATFNSAPEYEVEVQLVGKKVQAYSCDCGSYGKQSFCSHLTACFLSIRKHLQEKQTKKVSIQRIPESPKRLTTNVILKEVSLNDLQDFVKDYAKTNRQFAIALKTRFAGAISIMNREEKYTQLLDTAIKGVKRPNRGINAQGVKQITKLVKELQNQAMLAIETQDYQEAFAILKVTFQKVATTLRITERDKSLLLDTLNDNFPLLEALWSALLAPQLEIEIWQFILSSFTQGYLKMYQVDRSFLAIARTKTTNETRIRELLETIDFRQNDTLNSAEDLNFLLVNKLDLLNAIDQQELAAKLLQENLTKPAILLKALEFSRERNQPKKVEKLAKIGLKLNNQKEIVEQLEEILYQNAIHQKKKSAIIKWGKKRLLSTYEQKYWFAIKEVAKSKWVAHKQEILTLIQDQPYSIEQRDILAWAHHVEGDYSALIDFMKSTGSIELLLQYDKVIPESYRTTINDLYEQLLTEYLNQHLGQAAANKLKIIFGHLVEVDNKPLLNRLTKKIQGIFSDRQSLIEAMDEF